MQPVPKKAVFFDLDSTLFDHHHSLTCAIAAVQKEYSSLAGKPLVELINKYDDSLTQAYNEYLYTTVTYEEKDARKIQLFFTAIGLPEPTTAEAQKFRNEASRRLKKLRGHGYHLAIITNGQIEDQKAKAEAIGVHDLVDAMVTSEEVGEPKPDARIMKYAMNKLGLSIDQDTIYMVGDSANADILGAFNARVDPILYSPEAKNSRCSLYGEEVPIIRHMSQLLDYLGIGDRRECLGFPDILTTNPRCF
ncbi:hypothetical protein NM208_g13229 [Fusarium decemcellulare]|uniref:Uncharacterized protein n=1 Tax=Fusarium decemcellulare TaxID=57161 RepID=A0ACC1RP58_9HYPO|nr:hypothetical protein NM208_g13229 [Fusarium decemcellulare]